MDYPDVATMFSTSKNYICKSANLFETDSGFAIKAIGSTPWIILWATNAFRDRQREIFATRALEHYVLESEKKQDRGTINFWHINDGPGTDFSLKQWQGVIGRFLVEAGPFLASYQGQCALKFFTSYPEGHPKIAPEGWGCSPEFRYLSEERKTGFLSGSGLRARRSCPWQRRRIFGPKGWRSGIAFETVARLKRYWYTFGIYCVIGSFYEPIQRQNDRTDGKI